MSSRRDTETASYQSAHKAWLQQKSKLERDVKQKQELLAKTSAALTQLQSTAIANTDKNNSEVTSHQSLQLIAKQGRRTLAHDLSDWKSFNSETLLRFQLKILSDSLVNFQLSNNLSGGQTNLYVAFHAGKIITFAPKTTSKTVIGTYKIDPGKLQFQINMLLMPDKDIAELTIMQTFRFKVIVNQTPIALNGWNPGGKKNRGHIP